MDEKEKTVPFLRQLTAMLQNNHEELIEFVPGQRLPNETIHGKMVVHDRNRLQTEVLPIYFNHASFASLRRQLSYFSFVRVGKSRQSGVTYTNDAVIDLSDIRKLKRRAVGQAGTAVAASKQQKKKHSHPPQQQQQQGERQLATTSADVASAVLSGTLHAAKTNHLLDNSNSTTGGTTAAVSSTLQASTSPVCNTSSGQSSISQSITQSNSSSSSSDNDASKCSDNNNGMLTTEKKKKKPKSNKRKSIPKHTLPRKERKRFDRLLSINNIVPFIHLPAGHTLPVQRKKKSSESSTIGDNSGRSSQVSNTAHVGVETRALQKENKPKTAPATSKEEETMAVATAAAVSTAGVAGTRDRATSDGAINALLALGSDSQ